jgi:rRNA maturation endonuclease Nob1
VTQLKLLWRKGITEEDKDYWREQFGSGRARKEVRQELFERYQIELKQDVQLARFCNWVEEEDLRKGVYEEAMEDREELKAQGIDRAALDLELVRRMKERALARGDFKLGAKAVKLEIEIRKMMQQAIRTEQQGQRVAIAQKRMELQERKVLALEKMTKPGERMNALRPLTDEERQAIVDKADEIMGLK